MTKEKSPQAVPEEAFDLYDRFAHGDMDRREFLGQLSRFAVGGWTAAGLFAALTPNYALAREVDPEDARIQTERVAFPSPLGHGSGRGYLVRPRGTGPHPGVLVVHENRGLNPYIEDVTRRLGAAGFLAFAPDGLHPLGGYPGTDEEGKVLQRKLDKDKMVEDFAAAFAYLKAHPSCSGSVGVVGFCFGGWMCNTLAAKLPDLVAAVPFYGRAIEAEEVPKIQAHLLLHFAEKDERVNATWPAFQGALDRNQKPYQFHMYPGVKHGFHNDTTPRYDALAAKLAWMRTLRFFRDVL